MFLVRALMQALAVERFAGGEKLNFYCENLKNPLSRLSFQLTHFSIM